MLRESYYKWNGTTENLLFTQKCKHTAIGVFVVIVELVIASFFLCAVHLKALMLNQINNKTILRAIGEQHNRMHYYNF